MEKSMTKEQLLEAIKYRENEIANYQINIDNYSTMIEMLPQTYQSHLEKYKNVNPADLINLLPYTEIVIISDLQFKSQLEKLLLTEKLEQRKSIYVLHALQKRL